MLIFSFGTNTASVSRSWEIKVTQIECWSNARPYDSGCDQYFTGMYDYSSVPYLLEFGLKDCYLEKGNSFQKSLMERDFFQPIK